MYRPKDTAFDELRGLVREFILDNFHVPSGTSVLDSVSEKSRVVTVAVAAKQADVPISLLNRQLKLVGALQGKDSDNTVSDRTMLLPQTVVDEAVANVKKLASFAVSRAAIGAEIYTMERICAEGLVSLHFPHGDGGMPVFHQDRLFDFIERLQMCTDCAGPMSADHVSLPEAAARCHSTIAALLKRALEGAFRLASPLRVPLRLPDFYVNLPDVHRVLSKLPAEFISAATAAKLIGVRPRTIHAIAETGILPTSMVDYRLANRKVRIVRHTDLEDFANEYIVLRALSGTRKATFEETQLFIVDNGVTPLQLIGDSQKIFRRTEIEHIAYLPGGERLQLLLLVDEARLQALFSN